MQFIIRFHFNKLFLRVHEIVDEDEHIQDHAAGKDDRDVIREILRYKEFYFFYEDSFIYLKAFLSFLGQGPLINY